MSRHVLFTGAPGSRWSGIAKMMTSGFDTSDRSEERTYSHSKFSGHVGSYFDPEMEYEFERENWDKPFSGENGKRLIKSHTLATQLNEYKDETIVMVYRNDIDCYKWWHEAGGFDITYPNYEWYKNSPQMWREIEKQNTGIAKFIVENDCKRVHNLSQLYNAVGIASYDEGLPEFDEDLKIYVWN